MVMTSRVLVGLLMVVTLAMAGCVQGPDEGPPIATDMVRIPGAWVFEPAKIQVVNGTEVTWQNDGGQPHTITFDTLDIDETVGPGESVSILFDRPGTYTYICRFHPPDMDGTVLVTAGAATPTPA